MFNGVIRGKHIIFIVIFLFFSNLLKSLCGFQPRIVLFKSLEHKRKKEVYIGLILFIELFFADERMMAQIAFTTI